MKKVLFLHGFFGGGASGPGPVLRKALEGRAEVVSPDLPLHPQEALTLINSFCNCLRPDVVVGNSCGAFYAQIVASDRRLPALLGNPHLAMTDFLSQRLGEHSYHVERRDGQQKVIIDEALVKEFAEVQAHQFDHWVPEMRKKIWGIFGDKDDLAHYEPVFRKYYSQVYHFPGSHAPTDEEVEKWYLPLVERLLEL